jgi:hypothetical protein
MQHYGEIMPFCGYRIPVSLRVGNEQNATRSRVLGGVFGNPPDPSFWGQNSPIVMARTANLTDLKIYFDCGDEDDFGFNSGAAALDKSFHLAAHLA